MSQETPQTSRAGRVWAWVPALLLGSMLVGLGTLARIAVDDPHFALEPNYYDKAVHWDRARAEANASQALGLTLSLAPTLYRDADGSVLVELAVADRERAPLAGAQVELEAFPNAYASRAQRVTLHEAAPGLYRGKLEHGLVGLWELRVSVTRGADHFRHDLRRDVLKRGAA